MSEELSNTHWRCFHCDEVFTDRRAAKLHFGGSEMAKPSCRVSPEELREMERQLSEYREEDTSLHRRISALEVTMFERTSRAEEAGYGRGLVAGRGARKRSFWLGVGSTVFGVGVGIYLLTFFSFIL